MVTEPAYWRATARTVGIAAAVTVLCMVIGFPMAFFMAKVAKPRYRGMLVALVITPLWASYLVKVYAWQAMVQPETGVIAWLLKPFGLSGPGYGIDGGHPHADVPVAAVHDPAGLRRAGAAAATRSSMPPATSGPGRGGRCDRWCCRWCTRRSSPARCSPSR